MRGKLKFTLKRRLVALAAAYALALNALLPALTALLPPAALGESGVAVICSASGAGSASDRGAPEKPQPLCPCSGACAMTGCAATAAGLPGGPAASPVAPCAGAALAALMPAGAQQRTFWPGGSKLARAPPIA